MCSCIIRCISVGRTRRKSQGIDFDMFRTRKVVYLLTFSMRFCEVIELICKYARNGSNMCSTCLLVSPIVKFSFLQIHVFTDRLFSQKRRVTRIIRLKFMLTRHQVKEKVNALLRALSSIAFHSRCAHSHSKSGSFA